MPARWRTPPPHPNGWTGYTLPDHHTARVFYQGQPLVSLESMLLFIYKHRDQGWRLRKIGGNWRVVR